MYPAPKTSNDFDAPSYSLLTTFNLVSTSLTDIKHPSLLKIFIKEALLIL